ncbi:type II secretion system protein N [Stenotrophomonas humi]
MKFLSSLALLTVALCSASVTASHRLPAARPAAPVTVRPNNNSDSAGLRLLATFVNADPARSLAVIAIGNAPSQTLHNGQSLDNGVSVQAIERNRVILARGTQRFPLLLAGRPPSERRKPVAMPSASNTPASAAQAPGVASVTLLQGDNLGDIRRACDSAAIMASLSDAQKSELDALGMCTAH